MRQKYDGRTVLFGVGFGHVLNVRPTCFHTNLTNDKSFSVFEIKKRISFGFLCNTSLVRCYDVCTVFVYLMLLSDAVIVPPACERH